MVGNPRMPQQSYMTLFRRLIAQCQRNEQLRSTAIVVGTLLAVVLVLALWFFLILCLTTANLNL